MTVAQTSLAWLVVAITISNFAQCQIHLLGDYNGKTWYIARGMGHQESSRYACERNGWNLAELQRPDEVEWIFNNTLPTDQFMWTAGVNIDTRSGFIWGLGTSGGAPISNQIPFHGSEQFHDAVGLALSRERGSLVSKKRDVQMQFLCST